MKQIIIAILLLIPCITWGQTTYSYTMGHDANGSRTNRIVMRKMSNPVAGADSTILAIADSALLLAINAEKESRTNPDEIAVAEQAIINVYPNPASEMINPKFCK